MPAVIYSLAPAKFGSTVVPVKSITVSPSIVAEADVHSGNPYPTLIRVSGADPKCTLLMPFKPAYDALGFGVTKLTAFEVYLAKFTDFTRSSSSDHAKFALSGSSVAAAMITGAAVDQDGDLMATVDVVPITDTAMTNPLAFTTNNALPTLAAQPALYTLGPTTYNGTLIPGLISAGVDLGQILIPQRSDGSPYAMAASRVGATPRCFGEHGDPVTLLGTLGLLGVAASSNFVQYFRAYDATTGVVSNSAGSAISLTMAVGRAHPLDLGVVQNQLARMGVEFLPTSSTATHPIVVSAAATVPTVT